MSPNRGTEGAIAHDKIITTVLPRTPKRITRSIINAVPSKTTTQLQLNARAKVFKPLSPKQQQRTRITKAKAHWRRLNLSIDLSLLPQPTINTYSPSPIPASPDDAASKKESSQSEHRQQQQQQRHRSPTTPDTGDIRWVSALNIFQRAHPTIQDLISGPLFHDTEVQRLARLFGRRAARQEEWMYLARIRRVYYGRFLQGGQRAMGEGVPAGEEGRARLEGWVERAEGRVEELALDLGAVYLELRDRWGRWEGRGGEEEEEEEEEDFRGRRRRCREWVCGAGDAYGEGWTGRVEGGYVDAGTGYSEVVDDGVSNVGLGDTC